jgi:hypothetical protein
VDRVLPRGELRRFFRTTAEGARRHALDEQTVSVDVPAGLDWEVWRVVSSPRFAVPSPDTILREWSLPQLRDAHRVLDMYDELERLRRAPQ